MLHDTSLGLLLIQNQVRSWGINDNAALGRITTDVPDPKNPGQMIPNEDLESYPFVVETLGQDGFRAVQVAAGDSISVAISEKGELRAWGSFRVRHLKEGRNQAITDIVSVQRRYPWF